MSIQELKEKYKATEDPEMRKKIKEKVAALGKKMTKLKQQQKVETFEMSNDGLLALEKLEKKYKATDDPEMKKKIKMKMLELQKKKQMDETKKIEMTIKELEHKYNATDDPELKKKIKEKISELIKELKKKKK